MIFLYAFLVGGTICMLGQLILDLFKLTPAHITGLFVSIGVALDTFGLYDKLIEFSGAGALTPITSFGHSLLHGALEATNESGFIGIAAGMFSLTSTGIVSAIIFSFLVALIFKPKG